MEYLYFVLLCIIWPFRIFMDNVCSKKTKKHPVHKSSYDICKDIIHKNVNDGLLWASSLNYTDMWTRDTFFAFLFNKDLQSKFSDKIVSFQRSDGLIPLYIGKGSAFLKFCCSVQPTGDIKAVYSDVKTGDEPTDSCFQFIIMAYPKHRDACVSAWNYMQKYVVNGLIYENGLGTWQDTIKHRGYVAYTNILYYLATKLLYPKKADRIKKLIIDHLWNGKYFECSSTNRSFGQVDNALGLIYDLAPSHDSIFDIHRRYFSDKSAPPNLDITTGSSKPAFGIFDVYLPCWPLGNAKYHNGWSWSWVNLLFIKAKKKFNISTDLSYYRNIIRCYNTLYETYNKNGPINTFMYKSQPDFSEAAGIFLDIDDKHNHSKIIF